MIVDYNKSFKCDTHVAILLFKADTCFIDFEISKKF